MSFLTSCYGRICKDFRHKELLPLKILFFVNASSIAVLYPYLTIHMRELGINVEETAIMSAIAPIMIMIMPPLAGMVADKIGNFKVLLAILKVVTGFVALLLLLIPVGRLTTIYPTRVEMTIGVPSGDSLSPLLEIDVSQYSCNPLHPYAFDVNMRIETCGFICEWPSENYENSSTPLKSALSYAVKVRSLNESVTEVFRYPLGIHDRPSHFEVKHQSSVLNLTNNNRYKTALRMISQSQLFFPTDGMYDFVCKPSGNESDFHCVFGYNGTSFKDLVSSNNPAIFKAKLSPLNGNTTTKSGEMIEDVAMFGISKISEIKENDTKIAKVTFVDNFASANDEVSIELLFQDAGSKGKIDPIGITVQLNECRPKCLATAPRVQMCSNLKDQIEISPVTTFWSYMFARVIIGILGGTSYAMFEGAAIAILRENKADYGLQKIYGSIGGMISSPLSGLFIDMASSDNGYKDFRPAFYLYAVLKVLSAAGMLFVNLEFKVPASSLKKDFFNVIKNVEILTIFGVAICLGAAWGYIENFLFWLLQDLGASSSLMGITVTVGGIAGIPLLAFSGPIIDKIGHANVLFLGFLCYSIRLIGYSLIYNPWLCLIFESIEGVTTSLAFTALVTYAASLSTSTTDSSVQGIVGGLYFGVGRGAGSLFGGFLMKAVGTRTTYQIFALIMLLIGCLYLIYNKVFINKWRSDNEKAIESAKQLENGEKQEKTKPNNEKMPLKDSKANVNLYLDNVCKNNNSNENNDYNNTTKSNGVNNPAYEDTENDKKINVDKY